jgi:hypothetical protein
MFVVEQEWHGTQPGGTVSSGLRSFFFSLGFLTRFFGVRFWMFRNKGRSNTRLKIKKKRGNKALGCQKKWFTCVTIFLNGTPVDMTITITYKTMSVS